MLKDDFFFRLKVFFSMGSAEQELFFWKTFLDIENFSFLREILNGKMENCWIKLIYSRYTLFQVNR